MRLLLAEIPLDEVSTSMTINAPASLLLLLYELVAEEQGVPGTALRGTVQNDILKEYIARGNYIYPPRPSMRLTTDLFAYAAERIPSWNTISISGYHIREAGSTAVQELAFTLANGIAYGEAAVAAGLSPDEFGARLSFFFNAHNHFFQEVAKFRAARRLWATIMRDRFGATNPEGDGAPLPRADRRLDADRAAAGEQHRPRRDPGPVGDRGRRAEPAHERLRRGARAPDRALGQDRAPHAADPRGGGGRHRHRRSARRRYFIEALTDELEERARELIERIDELGGAVAAVEQGFVQREIEEAAFRWNEQIESGERVIVGVNHFVEARRPRTSSCSGSTPTPSAASSSGRRACGRSGTRRRPRPPSRKSAESRPARRTSCRPCARRSALASRSARSRTPSGTSSEPSTRREPRRVWRNVARCWGAMVVSRQGRSGADSGFRDHVTVTGPL